MSEAYLEAEGFDESFLQPIIDLFEAIKIKDKDRVIELLPEEDEMYHLVVEVEMDSEGVVHRRHVAKTLYEFAHRRTPTAITYFGRETDGRVLICTRSGQKDKTNDFIGDLGFMIERREDKMVIKEIDEASKIYLWHFCNRWMAGNTESYEYQDRFRDRDEIGN